MRHGWHFWLSRQKNQIENSGKFSKNYVYDFQIWRLESQKITDFFGQLVKFSQEKKKKPAHMAGRCIITSQKWRSGQPSLLRSEKVFIGYTANSMVQVTSVLWTSRVGICLVQFTDLLKAFPIHKWAVHITWPGSPHHDALMNLQPAPTVESGRVGSS